MYCEQKSCRNKKRNCDLRQLSYFYLSSLVPKERHVQKESNDSLDLCIGRFTLLSPKLICRLISDSHMSAYVRSGVRVRIIYKEIPLLKQLDFFSTLTRRD